MASQAAQVQAINQVPLILHGIDGRYATALFSAAAKQNELDKVEKELFSIKSILNQDAKLSTFLTTPTIDRQKKQQGIDLILGNKYSKTTSNFFRLLAENGRLGETGKILDSFNSLMVANRGEVSVVVTSAQVLYNNQALDAKSLTKVKDILVKNQLAGAGKKLLVSNKVFLIKQVNEQIIGGLVIEIGDNTIDMSVSSKITKLNSLLSQAV